MDYYERQRRREYWLWVTIAVLLGVLLLAKLAMAATVEVKLSWDGKDASGAVEASTPVVFTVFNADTLDVLSTAEATGPVTDFVMPSFSIVPPADQTLTLRLKANARDAAGNTSAYSPTVEAVIDGEDTIGPLAPVIQITITE